jgi:hypothetical protein
MADADTKTSPALAELPTDELMAYGCNLGLPLRPSTGRGEMLRRIRERQELLVDLDREALLDVCIWARLPVRQSTSKEHLAKEIAGVSVGRYDGLSHRGLVALARLRDVELGSGDTEETIRQRLAAAEPLWEKLRRKRRGVIGSVLSKIVSGANHAEAEYKFLPEEMPGTGLREQIEQHGVAGGIARKIKGVADDYVREKLDEIEARIDRKLDEIDHRLAEWRDREITNRLRIIKITLVASILVAAISLGYSAIRASIVDRGHAAEPVPKQPTGEPME